MFLVDPGDTRAPIPTDSTLLVLILDEPFLPIRFDLDLLMLDMEARLERPLAKDGDLRMDACWATWDMWFVRASRLTLRARRFCIVGGAPAPVAQEPPLRVAAAPAAVGVYPKG